MSDVTGGKKLRKKLSIDTAAIAAAADLGTSAEIPAGALSSLRRRGGAVASADPSSEPNRYIPSVHGRRGAAVAVDGGIPTSPGRRNAVPTTDVTTELGTKMFAVVPNTPNIEHPSRYQPIPESLQPKSLWSQHVERPAGSAAATALNAGNNKQSLWDRFVAGPASSYTAAALKPGDKSNAK